MCDRRSTTTKWRRKTPGAPSITMNWWSEHNIFMMMFWFANLNAKSIRVWEMLCNWINSTLRSVGMQISERFVYGYTVIVLQMFVEKKTMNKNKKKEKTTADCPFDRLNWIGVNQNWWFRCCVCCCFCLFIETDSQYPFVSFGIHFLSCVILRLSISFNHYVHLSNIRNREIYLYYHR